MQTCPKLEQMTATSKRIEGADISGMSPRKALKLAYMSREYKDRIAMHKRRCPICKANAAPKPAQVEQVEGAE